MLQIAICDDSGEQARIIAHMIDTWATAHGIAHAAMIFSSAEEFLFEYADNKSFDIIFLDVQMPGMNGVELAEHLRRTDKSIQIVFVSGYENYIAKGYEVEALHYLLKPIEKLSFERVLDKAMARINGGRRYIILDCGTEECKLSVEDIVYAQSLAHYIKIYTETGEYMVHMTMAELGERLGRDFVRAHRSYIVNAAYIGSISKTSMTLDTGAVVPISKGQRDEVNRKFLEYYRQ